jgi:hypothetical protein
VHRRTIRDPPHSDTHTPSVIDVLPEEDEPALRLEVLDENSLRKCTLMESNAFHHIRRTKEIPQTRLYQSIYGTQNFVASLLAISCLPYGAYLLSSPNHFGTCVHIGYGIIQLALAEGLWIIAFEHHHAKIDYNDIH